MSQTEALRFVRFETEGALARVTLARPDKLNALNGATLAELDAVFEKLQAVDGLRAVILTGAGERAFAAGADIAEIEPLDVAGGLAFSRRGSDIFRRIEVFPVPVIAAVNGYALGGGLELALACTIRIASDTARFGQPEVKLGVIPGYGGTQRLPRLIGPGPALHLLTTGEVIDAAEALRLGLVSRVVPASELMPAAEACAALIAANGPLAVRRCLEAVREGAGRDLAAALTLESEIFAECCGTEEMKEGTRAFLEKRAPVFRQ